MCPASSCISERPCGTKQFLGQHFAVKIQIVGQKVGNIGISVIRLFHTFPASSNLIFDLIQPRTVFFRVACRRPPPQWYGAHYHVSSILGILVTEGVFKGWTGSSTHTRLCLQRWSICIVYIMNIGYNNHIYIYNYIYTYRYMIDRM